MGLTLFYIPIVPSSRHLGPSLYDVRALGSVRPDGKMDCEVLESLLAWSRSNKEFFEIAQNKLRHLQTTPRNLAIKSKSVTPDAGGRPIFETGSKGHGGIRIFFFYCPVIKGRIVCTNVFEKSEGKKRQSKAFDIAFKKMCEYLNDARSVPLHD